MVWTGIKYDQRTELMIVQGNLIDQRVGGNFSSMATTHAHTEPVLLLRCKSTAMASQISRYVTNCAYLGCATHPSFANKRGMARDTKEDNLLHNC